MVKVKKCILAVALVGTSILNGVANAQYLTTTMVEKNHVSTSDTLNDDVSCRETLPGYKAYYNNNTTAITHIVSAEEYENAKKRVNQFYDNIVNQSGRQAALESVDKAYKFNSAQWARYLLEHGKQCAHATNVTWEWFN